MMKRIIALLSVCALMLTGFAMADGVSGEFTGTVQGFAGEVKVTLTLTDGKITDAVIEGAQETPAIGGVAIEKLAEAFKTTGSIAQDVVSTATVTSTAVLEAAAAALTAAGLNPEDYKTAVAAAEGQDATYDADVVVIGGGGAGMTAAITAADAGKQVILVESQPILGGNSVRATGGMNATGTKAQQEVVFEESAGVEKTINAAKENYADHQAIQEALATVEEEWKAYQEKPEGYFDSVSLMVLDTLVGGRGKNNPELVKTLAANTAAGIEWLETIGIKLPSVSSFGGASVKRIHRPLNEEGKVLPVGSYMVPLLNEAVAGRNVQVLTETTAHTLLTNEAGAAVGVVATGKNGETVTINAKAVVLTTGGFGGNLAMVEQYQPKLKGFMSTNTAGAQGQGIVMAEAIGAATVDMDQIQIHPTVQYDSAGLITEGLRGDGAILVNQEGKRFTNELGTRDEVSAAEISQPGGYAFLIMDQGMADASTVIQGYINKGYTVTGETPAALAEAMGVDGEALTATMDAWLKAVEAKEDTEFGRTSFNKALDTAPYYAIKVTPGVHHTMGGVVINTAAEVLRADGTAIPGLFAAGEVTGGVHGANRLGGNAVADFVVYGRIAGESVVSYLK